jgi:hypothetical protein
VRSGVLARTVADLLHEALLKGIDFRDRRIILLLLLLLLLLVLTILLLVFVVGNGRGYPCVGGWLGRCASSVLLLHPTRRRRDGSSGGVVAATACLAEESRMRLDIRASDRGMDAVSGWIVAIRVYAAICEKEMLGPRTREELRIKKTTQSK